MSDIAARLEALEATVRGEQVDLVRKVQALQAEVAHLGRELAKRDERIVELESAKTRQGAALKDANQAKRTAELAVAAVTLVADPAFDHTAAPSKARKEASMELPPATVKLLNPETKVSISDDGLSVTASVKALAAGAD